MLSNQAFRILQLFMHLLCIILGHDISNNRSTPLGFLQTLLGIYMAAFPGQRCSHICFLRCFPYISLLNITMHISINNVLPPIWLRINKNLNSYHSLLQLLSKCTMQPLLYL